MNRISVGIIVALCSPFATATFCTGQEYPSNPLRSGSRTSAKVTQTNATAEIDAHESTSSASNFLNTEPKMENEVSVRRAAVEPRRVQPAADAQPIRRTAARTRPSNRAGNRVTNPIRLLQFGMRVPYEPPRGYYVPGERIGAEVYDDSVSAEPIVMGELYDEEIIDEGVRGSDCCGGVGCGDCGGIYCPSFRNMEFFGGVHGVTGMPNRGSTASFGFDYGFNWGAPVYCLTNGEIGAQAGIRHATSNYDGASYSAETRNQYFITAGIFRRVDYGIQGGVVFDYLGESWYYNSDLTQLRGEMSWMFPECHEIGFWFANRLKRQTDDGNILVDQRLTETQLDLGGVDQYRFFYRRRFEDCGAEGRFSAGFTEDGDGIIGADIQMPMSDCWALESTFSYLIPQGDGTSGAFANEAWNVAIGLVWYPGMRKARSRDYYRPLFNVADNGSFMVGSR